MPEDEHSSWFYIRQVRLGQFFTALKWTFAAGIGAAIIAVVGFLIVSYGAALFGINLSSNEPSAFDRWAASVPWDVKIIAATGAILWIKRGQTIQIPKLTFGQWLGCIALLGMYALVLRYCSGWVIFSMFVIFVLLLGVWEYLKERGKENCRAERAGIKAPMI